MEAMAIFTSLDDMRRNQQLCDVILEVEGKQFPVHRVILAANSLYFRALFTNGMHETSENVIKIPSVTPELMERILEYAYSRETTITEYNVGKLLPVADQFNIRGLVDMCCRFLVKQLSPENCIGIWRYAKSYFCFKLEKEAFDYILVHFEETALQTISTEFQTLAVEEFEEILLQDRLNVKMEEYVFESVLKWISHDEGNRKENIHRWASSVISRPRLPYQLMFSIGGWSGGSPTSAIECYDTRADRWVLVDTVNNRPRAYMGIAVLGRKLYAVGGFDSNQYFNSVRCFNPVTKSWKEVAPMNSRRCYVSVATLGGCLYAMGGFDGHTRLRSVER
ncbi:putative kelch-like protein 10 [Apostichopus japonicus]|uniref:Putative kelch-like protein 10 n=1 Tax=Stichopus japonicus TaxID=307972 RepID=A0A2G8L0Q2_STIJA|nr:putative kelch-like protein 10 [Apostichopus japonicus]